MAIAPITHAPSCFMPQVDSHGMGYYHGITYRSLTSTRWLARRTTSQMKQVVSCAAGQYWKDHIQKFEFGFAVPVPVGGLSARIDALPFLSPEKKNV